MLYTVPHYIAGEPVIRPSTQTALIHDPARGQPIGQLYFADKTTGDGAILAAKNASVSWSQTPAMKRAQILFKFRALLEKNQADLARIVTQEHGKTLDDAKGSIARGIEVVELYCGLISQLEGTYSNNVSSQIDCYTLRQPLGVCVGISPFNFPVMVPLWMMIPAIACGNTFILKPSEQDPSAPIRLLELLSDAGLPSGVANCLQGDKTIVDYLLQHPDVAAVTAVASTPVAKAIYTTATAHGKRSHTFGSAKNHGVVMPDADLDEAASALVGAAFGSAGERCMAISVVVVLGEKTADVLRSKLTPLIEKIKINAGDAPLCDMGPLISHAHRQRVLNAIQQGVEEGATLCIDGRGFIQPNHPAGYFLGPSLFDNVTESMSIYQQEIFGPVLVMVRVKSLDDAINLINRNPYGNGCAIFTQDGYSAREFSQRVNVGMVGINIPIPVPIASHPFGGWKQSSFGDTKMQGLESIHFYTQRKTITSKWPKSTEASTRHEDAFTMPSHR